MADIESGPPNHEGQLQPWKMFWPPKEEDCNDNERKSKPWLNWEPDPEKPDSKPWYNWMRDATQEENDGIICRRGAG